MDQIERIDNYVFDERFYQQIINGVKVYAPSVTYILGAAYPIGYGLSQWRGDVGNKRADEILEETSADGSYVHEQIENILNGGVLLRKHIEETFSPKRALKIMRCLQSFLDWYEEYKPEVLATEYVVWNSEHNFAGTVDLKCKIGDETYIVDFKTSKSIHDQHKVQICAYGLADKVDKVALLHLGNTTKKRYSFNVLKEEYEDRFTNQFLVANKLFQTLHPNASPTTETFPDQFKI